MLHAGVAMVGMAVAGCSSPTAGMAVPAPAGGGQQLAPEIRSPREVAAFGERPCDVFTPEQLVAFGLDQPPDEPRALPSGNLVCTWIDSGRNGELTSATYPDSDILEREYSNRSGYPVFEPIEIAGMPAIMRQNSVGSSRCVVVVGLAEQQGLNVGFTDLREPYEDPCGAARMAAEVAVGNLPPLSGG